MVQTRDSYSVKKDDSHPIRDIISLYSTFIGVRGHHYKIENVIESKAHRCYYGDNYVLPSCAQSGCGGGTPIELKFEDTSELNSSSIGGKYLNVGL